jgi:hypothetical protein
MLIATAAGPQSCSLNTDTTITGWSIATNPASTPITESSGVFTIQKAGIYKIAASTTFEGFNGGSRQLTIKITSSLTTDSSTMPVLMAGTNATYQWQRNICCIEKLAANDTIWVTALQAGNTTLNVSNSTLQIVRIS